MWANAKRHGRPAKYRWRPLFNAAKFGWRPLLECCAVTLPRRETRWNLQGFSKLANRSQPLVARSSSYYEDMWRMYWCLMVPLLSSRRASAGTHFRPAESRRLSWPRWLVKYRGGLPARRRPLIPVLAAAAGNRSGDHRIASQTPYQETTEPAVSLMQRLMLPAICSSVETCSFWGDRL